MRFFFSFDSVWEGGLWAARSTRCCPTAHPHTPGLILSASDGIWNMLFSTCSHTSRWVRFRFGGCLFSCRGSCPSNSPFALSRLANLTHAVAARFVSASPLGSTTTAVCCTSLTSNSSPPDIGRAVFFTACSYHGSSRRLATATHCQRTQTLAAARHPLVRSLRNPYRIACGTRTRGHRLSMKRRPIECALMDQSFRASSCPTLRRAGIAQDALLDMIDAIDADMNRAPW